MSMKKAKTVSLSEKINSNCPLVAVLSGIILLSRSRFFISAAIFWLAEGPLVAILFVPGSTLQLWHVHHIASFIALVVILLHCEEIFDVEGFVFGMISFASYMLI